MRSELLKYVAGTRVIADLDFFPFLTYHSENCFWVKVGIEVPVNVKTIAVSVASTSLRLVLIFRGGSRISG